MHSIECARSIDLRSQERGLYRQSDEPVTTCWRYAFNMSRSITLFSFGYWGWGNATRQLVRAVDAVEESRGYEPPLFVDIRIRREGRAKGFVGEAFARTVGEDRYEWMRGLGNQSVVDHTSGIRIADPAQALDLLDRAIEASGRRQRVLYFCSCPYPINDFGPCHRTVVAELVLDAAKRQGRAAEVIEWPGDEPRSHDLRVSPEVGRRLASGLLGAPGLKNIPLGEKLPAPEWLGLAWGSPVRVDTGSDPLVVLSGPAHYASERWRLPVIQVFEGTDAESSAIQRASRHFRRERGYDPMKTPAMGVNGHGGRP